MANRNQADAVAIIAIFAIILCFLASNAQAWSNGGYSSDPRNPDYGTHDWIAEMALTIQTEDVSFLSVTYRTDYLLGTEAPDNSAYIGDTSNHHVYYHSDGSIQDDKSADRASEMYQSALSYIESNDLETAAYMIGAMTHYIADVGVFGHTMGSGTDWGAETHHSDYENAIESIIETIDLPQGIPLRDKTAYQAALDLARTVTFGSGDVKPNVWMDDNYLWTDPEFEASAMASLYASVEAVAAAINHLMREASPSPEPPPAPEEPPAEEPEDLQPPKAPLNPNATLVDDHVVLRWRPPIYDGGSPVVQYHIYRQEGWGTFLRVSSVDADVFSWNDSAIQAGQTYHYRIRAQNSIGLGEFSETTMIVVPEAEKNSSGSTLDVSILALPSVAVGLGLGGLLVYRRRKPRREDDR